jgi:hypothetical protein
MPGSICTSRGAAATDRARVSYAAPCTATNLPLSRGESPAPVQHKAAWCGICPSTLVPPQTRVLQLQTLDQRLAGGVLRNHSRMPPASFRSSVQMINRRATSGDMLHASLRSRGFVHSERRQNGSVHVNVEYGTSTCRRCSMLHRAESGRSMIPSHRRYRRTRTHLLQDGASCKC